MNYVFIDEIHLIDNMINPVLTKGKYVIAKPGDANIVGFVDVVLGLSKEKILIYT